MNENPRQPSIDDFLPKKHFRFPDGAVLTLGTKCDDDDFMHYGVHLVFVSTPDAEPGMNILLPPHSIDVLIPVLQDLANQARFIMGQNMVEYPPMPETRKPKRKKPPTKKAGE